MELKSIMLYINIYDGGRMLYIQKRYSNLFKITSYDIKMLAKKCCIYDSGIVTSSPSQLQQADYSVGIGVNISLTMSG